MVYLKKNPDFPVFDLITEDHSYIANSIRVHDDFPQLELYPKVALVLSNIVSMIQPQDTEDCSDQYELYDRAPIIYKKYYQKAIQMFLNELKTTGLEELFDKKLTDYKTLLHDQNPLVFVASRLWDLYLPEIESLLK